MSQDPNATFGITDPVALQFLDRVGDDDVVAHSTPAGDYPQSMDESMVPPPGRAEIPGSSRKGKGKGLLGRRKPETNPRQASPAGEECYSKNEPMSPDPPVFIPGWTVRTNNSALSSSRVCMEMVENSYLPLDADYIDSADQDLICEEMMHASVGSTLRAGKLGRRLKQSGALVTELSGKIETLEKEKKVMMARMEELEADVALGTKRRDAAIASVKEENDRLHAEISELKLERVRLQATVDRTAVAMNRMGKAQGELQVKLELEKKENLLLKRRAEEAARKSRQESGSSQVQGRKTGSSQHK